MISVCINNGYNLYKRIHKNENWKVHNLND
jgi:hypothetical protein